MKKFILGIIALSLLSGCASVDVAAIRAQIDQKKAEIASLHAQVDGLQKLAQESGNEKFIAAANAAEATLKLAEAKLPELETQLNNLQDQAPPWKVAAAFAVPFLPRIIALIPGIGVFAEPLAQLIGNLFWAAAATKKQKLADQQSAEAKPVT